MRKKLFTLLLAIVASVGTIFASTQIGSLYYNLNSETKTAEVTFEDRWWNYAGITIQTIPPTIEYNGETYAVTRIGEYAFRGCSWWRTFIIPNSVTSIGAWAFESCSGLTSVTIPSSVTSIEWGAFRDCSSLTSITIPSSVTSIENGVFNNCSSLTSINVVPDNLTYSSVDGVLFNKDQTVLIQYPVGSTSSEYCIPNSVTNIGDYAFYGCSSLTSITISNSVTSIGSSAFSGCAGLTSITIPNSVNSIGSSAFQGCSGLTSVTIPNSVTDIGGSAFENCTGLTSVVISNSVTDIGGSAFENCTGLSSVTIPNSVTSIGYRAFYNCSGLTSVTIPNSVTSIEGSAFSGCSGLTSVHITDIAAWCKISFSEAGANPLNFAHDLYLNGNLITDLVVPNGTTDIGNYSFYGCTSLTSVTIPNSVASIGDGVFSNCRGLTFITVDNDNPNYCSIEGVLFNKDKTLLINYPGGKKSSLYVIPNSVTSIGNYSFYGCTGLASVTIPNSVTNIGEYAFSDCSGLEDIYLKSITPPYITIPYGVSSDIFSDILPLIVSNATIHVQFGCINTYKSDYYWKYMNLQGPKILFSMKSLSTSALIIFNVEDVILQSCGISGGEQQPGNVLEYIGLEPNSEYKDVPVVLTSTEGLTETVSISFTTTALELTTKPSKAVSSNTAILLAETNMSDAEVSCGFEWKRNDAPADMVGTKVFCPVLDGQMAGRLKNLKDDVYYKYRAFYQSAAGNMYYGDWQYIFTGDNTVEFDPILYTYGATVVKENEATISGYALAGSEDFTEQGFEYWAESRVGGSANGPARMPAALNEHFFVQASGISLRVTLTNLDAGTVYKYRVYGKAGDQYYYGSEQTFTTQGEYKGDDTEAIEDVQIDNTQSTKAQKILHNGQIYILRGEKVYTVTGQEVK